jgi:leucyl aminopeptidase
MLDAKDLLLLTGTAKTVPIHVVTPDGWSKGRIPAGHKAWGSAQGFEAAPLSLLVAPAADGAAQACYVGAPRASDDPFALGAISSKLPSGDYHFAGEMAQPDLVALGWLLELYKYDPYRPLKVRRVRLAVPKGVEHKRLISAADASALVRDLINTPSNQSKTQRDIRRYTGQEFPAHSCGRCGFRQEATAH